MPVSVSITGKRWILLFINDLIASNKEALGPILTNGCTCSFSTSEKRKYYCYVSHGKVWLAQQKRKYGHFLYKLHI